jgi:type I restriction enzyme S subunit
MSANLPSVGRVPSRGGSPEGAKEKPLAELVRPRREKAIPAEHPDLSYIGLEHVEAHTTKLLGSVPATEMKSTANRFRSGDVLYSRLRPYLNKVWHADRDGLCSSEFIVLPGNDLVDANFLRYRLNSHDFVSFANSLNAGDRPRVDFDQISTFQTWLPSTLTEQRRIVAEIEKQFTRLEAGVAALRRVQANLKRYRAAVLKAACEGRLVPTEAELVGRLPSAGVGRVPPRGDRAKTKGNAASGDAAYNDAPFETGAELLARILTERRQDWQGRGKYKEPAAPNTTNLPTLPETWTWVSWEMVLAHEDGAFKRGPFGSALTKAIFVEKGFKVYEQYCPINDDCSFARYYVTPEKFEELQAFEVKGGDYLISCSGVTLGRITRVPEQFERGIINQALLRVRINESVIDHRYFLHLFRSALFQKAIFDNSTGSAIPNVKGVKELKAMAIPLPPLAEQTRIVAEVERRLSVVEELESVVTANLQRATRLRQSILQKAFTGELA